ncbi:hypothetical protein [Acanthopleuribacter pedis]|uniref:Uncharacterized protein n=1 Tax=Acanthopleuribacter pedis TaxID=442870 RepID=A0A8J7Q6N6_9BACT|nr:hypothetical protein [Acanthopleuribacter pedis]MBO1318489.1 hypothetical protein [Acanthopleuribacter pedis]
MIDHCMKCHADFRGHTTCPRCGGDLTSILESAQQQDNARNQAFAALAHGDLHAAQQAAERQKTSSLDPNASVFADYFRGQFER